MLFPLIDVFLEPIERLTGAADAATDKALFLP